MFQFLCQIFPQGGGYNLNRKRARKYPLPAGSFADPEALPGGFFPQYNVAFEIPGGTAIKSPGQVSVGMWKVITEDC